ncbi:MAG: hypothetical protein QNJ53_04060 [Pleurocapsa sp. MO_192.B19]|nr:hypothetical protein [Pleurocapsa sp. MO_192.B19]
MADNEEKIDKEYIPTKAIAPGVKIIIRIGQRVRNSILDYALGAAILGLIPVYGRWIPEIRLILLAVLNFKMILNIGRFWGHHKGQASLAIVGCIFAIIGSVVLAVMAWLTIFALGLFIPLVDSLARAIAYSVLTWNIGHAVSRYYYSPQTLDTAALQKALQFQRSQRISSK